MSGLFTLLISSESVTCVSLLREQWDHHKTQTTLSLSFYFSTSPSHHLTLQTPQHHSLSPHNALFLAARSHPQLYSLALALSWSSDTICHPPHAGPAAWAFTTAQILIKPGLKSSKNKSHISEYTTTLFCLCHRLVWSENSELPSEHEDINQDINPVLLLATVRWGSCFKWTISDSTLTYHSHRTVLRHANFTGDAETRQAAVRWTWKPFKNDLVTSTQGKRLLHPSAGWQQLLVKSRCESEQCWLTVPLSDSVHQGLKQVTWNKLFLCSMSLCLSWGNGKQVAQVLGLRPWSQVRTPDPLSLKRVCGWICRWRSSPSLWSLVCFRVSHGAVTVLS